jgi:hypothetical protein
VSGVSSWDRDIDPTPKSAAVYTRFLMSAMLACENFDSGIDGSISLLSVSLLYSSNCFSLISPDFRGEILGRNWGSLDESL